MHILADTGGNAFAGVTRSNHYRAIKTTVVVLALGFHAITTTVVTFAHAVNTTIVTLAYCKTLSTSTAVILTRKAICNFFSFTFSRVTAKYSIGIVTIIITIMLYVG